MTLQDKIVKILATTLKTKGVNRPVVEVVYPTDLDLGDYATNVAMVYGKKLGVVPMDLARELVEEVKKAELPEVEKIEIAGFGFINFYLKRKYIGEQVGQASVDKNYGRNFNSKKQKIAIEYTDPNLFKLFHLGHLVSNAIGETISRFYSWQGYSIKRFCYQGDVGLHIAKTIYGLRRHRFLWWREKIIGRIKSRVALLGQSYTEGHLAYEDNPEAKSEIKEINKAIYSRAWPAVNVFYDTGRRWSLDYFDTIYAKLGTKFDFHIFESETAALGLSLVKEYLDKGKFIESQGAVVFPGDKYGLHARVFITSQGLATYEAKDLGLFKIKHDMFSYDQSVVVTGNEQTEYYKVVLKAAEVVFPELAKKTKHVTHGFLRLASGKMSSREGTVVTAEDLLQQVQTVVKTKINDEQKVKDKQMLEQVALGAIKFSILKQSPGKDIMFDFDKSLSFEGDSGPYLQYTVTRARSVLTKASRLPEWSKTDIPAMVLPVERLLIRWPEVSARAAAELAPQQVVVYLLQLASAFNSFYAEYKILGETDSAYRLHLTRGVERVLTAGLDLLAIPIPDKM
ncbi:MAG: arginine--tRNA ligase [Patescibacteria group bacterium]